MSVKVTGMKEARKGLARLDREIRKRCKEANLENAREVTALAKVLIPVDTGRSKAEIAAYPTEGDGALAYFGRKAKVIEGESGPRPFVNPALKATKAKRRQRNRQAVRDGIKAAFNG